MFGDNTIKVPEGKIAKLVDQSYIGKEVIMGIRPENLHDEEVFIQSSPDALVNANIEIVELMGAEIYLHFLITGKSDNITARVDPRSTARVGDQIKIAADVNKLHFFDKETEQTILNR